VKVTLLQTFFFYTSLCVLDACYQKRESFVSSSLQKMQRRVGVFVKRKKKKFQVDGLVFVIELVICDS
jgi:hypothetical protein